MKDPNIVAVFDIETLDLAPSAIVLSMGVVLFDISMVQPFDELVAQGTNLYFNQNEQVAKGRTESESTRQFWNEQGPEASECLDNPNKMDCEDLYGQLSLLYAKLNFKPDPKETRWFSRGYFDVVVMNDFCKTFELKEMFKYWAWRDARSFLDGTGIGQSNQKLVKPDEMIPHNSHHDAAFEAYMLQRLLNNAPIEVQEYDRPLIPRTYSRVSARG